MNLMAIIKEDCGGTLGGFKTLFSKRVLKRFWIPAVLAGLAAWLIGSQLTLAGWRLLALVIGGCVLALWLLFAWADAYWNPARDLRRSENDENGNSGGAGIPVFMPVGPSSRGSRDGKAIPPPE